MHRAGGKNTQTKFWALRVSQNSWSRDHKAEKQQDRAPRNSSVMWIILNFILRDFKYFEARDGHDQLWLNVENIFERGKAASDRPISTLAAIQATKDGGWSQVAARQEQELVLIPCLWVLSSAGRPFGHG